MARVKTETKIPLPANSGNAVNAGPAGIAVFYRRRQNGFSLIELVVTLAIIAIMTALVVPNLRSFMSGMRSNKAMYQVVESLRNARMLAMSQNRAVSVQFFFKTTTDSGMIEVKIRNESADWDKYDDTVWEDTTTVAPAFIASTTLEDNYRFIAWSVVSAVSSSTSYSYGPTPSDDIASGAATERFMFSPDGFLVKLPDFANPINGTIFISPPDGVSDSDNRLVRAVTVQGASGRSDGWQLKNGEWIRVR
jgi:type IV fimbrial biogenesis protein FimT